MYSILSWSDPTDSQTKLGKQTINQVTIINDDGKFLNWIIEFDQK